MQMFSGSQQCTPFCSPELYSQMPPCGLRTPFFCGQAKYFGLVRRAGGPDWLLVLLAVRLCYSCEVTEVCFRPLQSWLMAQAVPGWCWSAGRQELVCSQEYGCLAQGLYGVIAIQPIAGQGKFPTWLSSQLGGLRARASPLGTGAESPHAAYEASRGPQLVLCEWVEPGLWG